MKKTVFHSDAAPKAIGPYSQAVAVPAGRLVFLSGQTPLDPQTMTLVTGSIEDQAERVMKNLEAVLVAGGLQWAHVVKCTIFLTNMGDFARVNAVYGRYFEGEPPARSTVQVAGLPLGAAVEIEAIAVAP